MTRYTFKSVVDSNYTKNVLIESLHEWAVNGGDKLVSVMVLSEEEVEPENEEEDESKDK